MKWFLHAPKEEGFYWVRECFMKESGCKMYKPPTICQVVFTHYNDKEHIELYFSGNEREYDHDDMNWYYGPIEEPAFPGW